MKNPFERFYKTTVDIVKIEETGAYEKTYTETPLASVKADIQPYRGIQPFGESISEDGYGQKLDYQMRMYCDVCNAAVEGNFIRYNDKLYKIVYAAQWELGEELLLKEVVEYDRH